MMRAIGRWNRRPGRIWPWAGAITSLFALALAASPGTAETLHGALASAYDTSPDLRESRASLRAVDEQVPQALAGWRPNVSINGSAGYESRDSSATSEQSLNPWTAEFQVVQPLYSGGRTVAATSRTSASIPTRSW